MEFVQEAMKNDTYQEIGKEFLKILTDVIKDIITGDLDMIKIMMSVIKVIANSVDNLLTE